MSSPTDLFSQQQSNRSRSHWLIVGFVLFFAWLGFGGDLILLEMSRGEATGPQWDIPLFGLTLTSYAIVTTLWCMARGSQACFVDRRERDRAGATEQERLLSTS